VHGDVAAGNLIVKGGHLYGVIDFGCCGVGDPSCDLVMAWTFFDAESRGIFLNETHADTSMIARARGWALWKALITIVNGDSNTEQLSWAKRTILQLMEDYNEPY
jgi:aminoglycoside phosphotransferase (APT) family kinase protein